MLRELSLPFLLAIPAAGQICQPQWTGEFRPQVIDSGQAGQPFRFDEDGPGPNPPALYLTSGGASAGGVPMSGMARWNGRSWSPVPLGISGRRTVAVLDPDGPGPQPETVYLTGFTPGGYHGIYSWDGTTLTAVVDVGSLGNGSQFQTINNLWALDADGPGPEPARLYAGLEIVYSLPHHGVTMGAVYRLDPAGWTGIAGITGVPESAAVFDPDGSGPAASAVYIAHTASGSDPKTGGWLSTAVSRITGAAAEHIASSESTSTRYTSVATLDLDGPGPEPAWLYIGGTFGLSPTDPPAHRIARSDGQAILPFSALDGRPSSLYAVQVDPLAGGQPSLYATGLFTQAGGVSAANIARFGSAGWSPLGPGIPGNTWPSPISGLILHDDDGPGPLGPRLFASGSFPTAGYAPSRGIAVWDGTYWLPPGNVVSNPVHALVAADLGDGESLYAGGSFVRVGGLPVSGAARWNGTAWAAVGTGFDNHVDALAVHHEAGVPRLVAAGKFTSAGVPLNHVAILRSGQWQPLGAGLSGNVSALLAADGKLYAGGSFASVPGAPGAQRLAVWDGTAWRSLGAFDGEVAALAHFQGSLYAAGRFDHITSPDGTAGLYARIARFDGTRWVSPAFGLNYYATSMAVHNDGSGEALYVGGAFDSASGIPAGRVARWNGSSWSAVGQGLTAATLPTTVTVLASIQEGPGRSALYAGGTFTHSGASPVSRIARWDGAQWSALGAGVDDAPLSLAALDPDSAGPADRRLYVGGAFLAAGGAPSWSLASWSLCGCYANCDGSTAPPVLSINDFVCFQGLYAAGDPRANCDGSTVPPILNISDFICFQQKFAAGCP